MKQVKHQGHGHRQPHFMVVLAANQELRRQEQCRKAKKILASMPDLQRRWASFVNGGADPMAALDFVLNVR